MSMIRQVLALLLGVLCAALVASVASHALTTRAVVQDLLRNRNADGASMLALALSQQKGNPELMRLVLAAQFDTGHYESIRLLKADGSPLMESQAQPQAPQAPAWFRRLLPVVAGPGVAQVSDGWRALGRLEVLSHAAWATDALWAACLRNSAGMLALGLLAGGISLVMVAGWRRPLEAAVAQAQALEEGRYKLAAEPSVPELRSLTRSMNSMVGRVQTLFTAQARQVDDLRVLAHTDAVSGLDNRRQFVAQLDGVLAQAAAATPGTADLPGTAGALLILRLLDIEGLNLRLGHGGTNGVLRLMAQVLQAYPAQAEGAFAGRLNGSDFALYLPSSTVAQESATAIAAALKAALPALDAHAAVVVGGVDGLQSRTSTAALAEADTMLAEAEALGPFAAAVRPQPVSAAAVAAGVVGQRAWAQQLLLALQLGRAQLGEFPVLDSQRRSLHLECPLRVQLADGGRFEPAAQWLAMAARSRLLSQVDLAVVDLALAAIAGDRRARGINMSTASLGTAGFIRAVTRRLQQQPAQAALLWVEFGESAALQAAEPLQEAAARWRAMGCKLGLEHAGSSLRGLATLQDLALDYIKIDGRFVRGAAADAGVREFARSLVTLVRGLRMQVIAEGVDDAADLQALWALGFDGATGPAVAQPMSA